MSDDDSRGPVGRAVDLFVYAPIGVFFEGPELLPKLVEQGKGHVRTARFFGELAVKQGRKELERRFGAQAAEVLRGFGFGPDGHEPPLSTPRSTGTSSDGSSSDPAGSSSDGTAAGSASAGPSGTAVGVAEAAATRNGNGAVAEAAPAPSAAPTGSSAAPAAATPAVGDLAIEDYDSLSASQVVNRLAGLEGDELEAVRAYEVAHRGRRTILNKVAQLQA